MCKYCYVCGKSGNLELHHIIFRSKAPFLTNSILNHVYLCSEHHRGTFSPHGKNGHELDVKLKLEFQNKLEMLFDKEYLTEDEIKSVLEIGPTALKNLLKPLRRKPEGYYFLDVMERLEKKILYGQLTFKEQKNLIKLSEWSNQNFYRIFRSEENGL